MPDNNKLPETKTVALSLTPDEALVLHDLLSRLVDKREGRDLVPLMEHDAELWALNSVQCLLECELAAPLQEDYELLLNQARARLAECHGGAWPGDT